MTDTLKDYDFIQDENNQYGIITNARESTVYFFQAEITEIWRSSRIFGEHDIDKNTFNKLKKVNPNTNTTFLSMYNCFVNGYPDNFIEDHITKLYFRASRIDRGDVTIDERMVIRSGLKEILEKCSKANPTTIDDLLKVFLDKGQ